MNEFFTIVGSIASIGSIPLAIYLFIKSRESRFEKVKRDIVRILSYQIGESRELRIFEIETVINSKIRENRIKPNSITIPEIIEDLVAETISSPLLDANRKELILENLKKLYYKGEIFDVVDKLEPALLNKEDDSKLMDIDYLLKEYENILEEDIKKLASKRVSSQREYNRYKNKQVYLYEKFSTLFGLLAALITILFSLLMIIGENKINQFFSPLNKFTESNQFLLNLVLGIIASLISVIAAFYFRKLSNRYKKDVKDKQKGS